MKSKVILCPTKQSSKVQVDKRRAGPKMWWPLFFSCTSTKKSRAESRMEVEEMVNSQLETIDEEQEELFEENGRVQVVEADQRVQVVEAEQKWMAKIKKVKMGRLIKPQFSIMDAYVIFVSRFATKVRWG